MDITTFKICRRIVNGCGSFYGNIAEEAASLNGHKIFLVCDPILAKLGLTEKTAALLRGKGFEVAIHADVEPEPRVESVLAVAEQARAFGADCVIGIGGGSSLDTAKTCSVLLGNQQDIRDLYGIEKVAKPGAPLILVPTSAGTGSEVTDIAILSDEAAQLKMGIVSRHMLPASVILDPELTLSLPKGPTAASGMDALIHAMEAYTSIHATPLTDMWAEHAIALIAPNLRKAWARGEDIQARQAMLTGSFYAGVAFCNAGVTAVHAFAYPIGALPHPAWPSQYPDAPACLPLQHGGQYGTLCPTGRHAGRKHHRIEPRKGRRPLPRCPGKPGPRPAGAPPSCRLRRHARRYACAGRIRAAGDPSAGQQSA